MTENSLKATEDMPETGLFNVIGGALNDSKGKQVSNFYLLIRSEKTLQDEDREIGRDLMVDVHINGRIETVSITLGEFTRGGMMKKIYAQLGSEPILYGSEKDLRIAAQELSPQDPPNTIVYVSHGFSPDGSRYLSPGLEITTAGISKNAEACMSMGTYASRIAMIAPPSEPSLRMLGKHLVKDLLDLKDHATMYPLVGHLALAPFASLIQPLTGKQKPAMHLQGVSGGGKTFLANLLHRFFGNFDGRPLSWVSTDNSLEAEGYWLKDVLVVVDDFKAATSNLSKMIRIMQDHANSQGRGRLKPGGKTEDAKYIRGLLLSTGEDFVSNVESVFGRTIVLEVEPKQNQAAGRRCLACAGQYPMFMPGLIHHVISRPSWKEDFRREVDEMASLLQEELPSFSNAARIASNWALNAVGFTWFVDFLASVGALGREEHRDMLEEYDGIIKDQIQRHAEKVLSADPIKVFFEMLGQRLATGAVSVDGLTGNGSGKKIGKLSRDGSKVGLLPDETIKAIRSLGGKPPFTRDSLKAALLREGILEKNGDRVANQMRFAGERVQAWQFRTEDFQTRCGIEEQ